MYNVFQCVENEITRNHNHTYFSCHMESRLSCMRAPTVFRKPTTSTSRNHRPYSSNVVSESFYQECRTVEHNLLTSKEDLCCLPALAPFHPCIIYAEESFILFGYFFLQKACIVTRLSIYQLDSKKYGILGWNSSVNMRCIEPKFHGLTKFNIVLRMFFHIRFIVVSLMVCNVSLMIFQFVFQTTK